MDLRNEYPNDIRGYQKIELIGKGGFAEVYRASVANSYPGSCKDVAIKQMFKRDICQKNLYKRVQEEIDIHSTIEHDSIVKLYTHFDDEFYIYLVLELCDGGDLETYFKRRRECGNPCGEDEITKYFSQIVDGLIHCHEKKIMHRDLKLNNLLLHEGNVRIGDFGMATYSLPNDRHKTFCGTLPYVSPEVGNKLSHGLETDVYSLGVILYKMVVGRYPRSPGDYVTPLEVPNSVSEDCKNLVERCLEVNVKDRIALRNIPSHPFLISRSKASVSGDSGMYTISTNNTRRSTHIYNSMTQQGGLSYRASGSCGAYSYEPQMNECGSNILQPDPGGYRPIPSIKTGCPDVASHGPAAMQELRKKMNCLPQMPHFSSKNFHHLQESSPYPCHRENPIEDGLIHMPQSTGYNHLICPPPPITAYKETPSSHGGSLTERISRPRYHQGREEGIKKSRSLDRVDVYRSQDEDNIKNYNWPLDRRKAFDCDERSHHSCINVPPQSCCHEYSSHGPNCSKYDKIIPPTNFLDGNFTAGTNSKHPNSSYNSDLELRNQKNLKMEFNRDNYSSSGTFNSITNSCNSRKRSTLSAKKSLSDKCDKINTKRLKPAFYHAKEVNVVLHILANGCVCVESIEKRKGRNRVVKGWRISADGDKIDVYNINDGKGGPVKELPYDVPESGADSSHSYDSLPHEHWKRYIQASKFVNIQKCKTVKVTFFSEEAKGVLMENSPHPDFEVIFYRSKAKLLYTGPPDSSDVNINKQQHKVSSLSSELSKLHEHASMIRRKCLKLDELHTSLGEEFFPVTVGQKPSWVGSLRCKAPQLSSTSHGEENKENMAPSNAYQNVLAQHPPPHRNTSRNSSHFLTHQKSSKITQPLDASLVPSKFPLITNDGERIEFEDGTSLEFLSDSRVLYRGQEWHKRDLPKNLEEKLVRALESASLKIKETPR